MTSYYFDLEVYSKGQRPDPRKDKVITIQYQKVDMRTGEPHGDLKILKEWESSEEEIVNKFYDRFFKNRRSVWDFVPIGNNLNFEFEFLKEKFSEFCDTKLTSFDLHYNTPHLDLKHLLVVLNSGEFKGSGLHNFTGKTTSGRVIREFYEEKQYDKIETYVVEETAAFLEFLQKTMKSSGKWLHDVVDV
ncbi:MAG: hypothetical protein GOV01_02050 [Candidatus Altiarchaeota archaeon]|nr:hypothetical protein [Candidatus Altiarchaeota archaeon]